MAVGAAWHDSRNIAAEAEPQDDDRVAERRVVVVAGEVHRYHPMPSSLEVRRHESPAPRPDAGAVNERYVLIPEPLAARRPASRWF